MILPFLEIQDVPTFYRFIGIAEVLKDSFKQFFYNFGKIFIKMAKCKPNIIPLNVFLSILRKVGVR